MHTFSETRQGSTNAAARSQHAPTTGRVRAGRLAELGTAIDASPRMAAQRAMTEQIHQGARMTAQRHALSRKVPNDVVQRRPLDQQEAAELDDLGANFDVERIHFSVTMRAIEKILGLVDPLPVNIRYLGNRVASTLRPLDAFFTDAIALTGSEHKTDRVLQRARRRYEWYTKNGSARKLLQLTLDDARQHEPMLRTLMLQQVLDMASRGARFAADRVKGQTAKEIRKGETGVARVDNIPTPALLGDPEHSVSRDNWTEVSDHPPGPGKNKFVNMYHASAMIMMENYRDRSKGYYASDALFDQWMRASNSATLMDLPFAFPAYFYRNHIDNARTKEVIAEVLGGQKSRMVNVGTPEWRKLAPTDNVKSTLNIVSDYNKINRLRKQPTYRCQGVLIYAGPTLKFSMVVNG